ncbi:MAG: hypothetical protein AB8E82_01640 [Aureispira sp.]
MPNWGLGIGISLVVGMVGLIAKNTKKWALFIGVVLGLIQYLAYAISFGNESPPLVIKELDATYVIYNNCLLYCRPVVYKKVKYGPFLYKKQVLRSEQPIQNYRVEGGDVYVSNGMREWFLE